MVGLEYDIIVFLVLEQAIYHNYNVVWQEISEYIKCNISWKTIVCGFPMYPISNKIESINFIVILLPYVIFKENSYCKFNEKLYINVDIKSRIKENIFLLSKGIGRHKW